MSDLGSSTSLGVVLTPKNDRMESKMIDTVSQIKAVSVEMIKFKQSHKDEKSPIDDKSDANPFLSG